MSYILILEHSFKTKIALVGLQVWRGAFLLGDMLIHLGLKGDLKNKTVLELGAGTGLTSFVAALYAKKVVCTGRYHQNHWCIVLRHKRSAMLKNL